MESVWIVKGHWDYEGFIIVDVFASESDAKAEAKEQKAFNNFDDITYSEYEVKAS